MADAGGPCWPKLTHATVATRRRSAIGLVRGSMVDVTLPTQTALTELADAALRACGAPGLSATGAHSGAQPDHRHDPGRRRGYDRRSTRQSTGPRPRSNRGARHPAPLRGELIRQFAVLLRAHKADLGRLVQIEVGKIESEALGEVQEMIDICDFAVGLSRQLHGLTIASERPGHRLMEQWHPLGPTGVITAFNFPVAVWSWNAALAVVCGNPVIWKPSDLTPLTAHRHQPRCSIRQPRRSARPAHLSQVVLGGADVGAALVAHAGVPLVSATGSTRDGPAGGRCRRRSLRAQHPRARRQQRGDRRTLGRHRARRARHDVRRRRHRRAALHLAAPAIVHRSRIDEVVERMSAAYATLPIGSPLDAGTLGRPADHRRPHSTACRRRSTPPAPTAAR